jgi:hypothetical protein
MFNATKIKIKDVEEGVHRKFMEIPDIIRKIKSGLNKLKREINELQEDAKQDQEDIKE